MRCNTSHSTFYFIAALHIQQMYASTIHFLLRLLVLSHISVSFVFTQEDDQKYCHDRVSHTKTNRCQGRSGQMWHKPAFTGLWCPAHLLVAQWHKQRRLSRMDRYCIRGASSIPVKRVYSPSRERIMKNSLSMLLQLLWNTDQHTFDRFYRSRNGIPVSFSYFNEQRNINIHSKYQIRYFLTVLFYTVLDRTLILLWNIAGNILHLYPDFLCSLQQLHFLAVPVSVLHSPPQQYQTLLPCTPVPHRQPLQ